MISPDIDLAVNSVGVDVVLLLAANLAQLPAIFVIELSSVLRILALAL